MLILFHYFHLPSHDDDWWVRTVNVHFLNSTSNSADKNQMTSKLTGFRVWLLDELRNVCICLRGSWRSMLPLILLLDVNFYIAWASHGFMACLDVKSNTMKRHLEWKITIFGCRMLRCLSYQQLVTCWHMLLNHNNIVNFSVSCWGCSNFIYVLVVLLWDS